MEVNIHIFLTSVDLVDECECSVPQYGGFMRRKGGWVGPTAGLGVMARRKISAPSENISPFILPVASHSTE
jgi:hypothetical protein